MIFLLTANTIAAIVPIAFAVLGGERFYGRMDAVSGVPLGIAAGLAPLLWAGPAASLIRYAAAAAQAGDAAIGVASRKWTMIAGGTLLGVVHVVTAAVAD